MLSNSIHMKQYEIADAKHQLTKLVDEVQAGEEIIIAKSGKPVARLLPYAERKTLRQPGRWRDRICIADDFDETPQELIDAFEGRE